MIETSSIYSVSIPYLRSVCGGGDTTVAESASTRLASRRPIPNDYRVGPRIHVSWKSELFLNERQVSKAELIEDLLHPKWQGTTLYHYREDPPTGYDSQGEFQKAGSFSEFLYGLGKLFLARGTTMRDQFSAICTITRKDGLEDTRKTTDLLSEPIPHEEFVVDLLKGKRRYRHRGRDYGFALETICDSIGTSHGVLGTDRLRSLEIETPLRRIGSPIRLPKIEGGPDISYLDEEGLDCEYNRLLTFKFSSDPSLLAMQKKYQAIIESSWKNERGIVAFYY